MNDNSSNDNVDQLSASSDVVVVVDSTHGNQQDSSLQDASSHGSGGSYTTAGDAAAAQPTISVTATGNDEVHNNSDSDDDSSILEVLPPSATAAKRPPVATKKTWTDSALDDDSDDSDDSLLNGPTYFGGDRNNATATKRSTTTTITSSSITRNRQLPMTADEKKQAEKDHQRRERERDRDRKQAQKAAEQAAKRAEREAAAQEKKRQKEAAGVQKKRQKKLHEQAKGKFATSEIVCLVDSLIYRRRTPYDWTQHEEIVNHNLSVKEYRSALGGLLGNTTTNLLLHPPSCHAVQWIRQDHLKGGAEEAWKQLCKHGANDNQTLYTHSDRLVMVFDRPQAFIQLLERTEQDNFDDDYPKLRQWLRALTMNWQAQWPTTATSSGGNNGDNDRAAPSSPSCQRPNILLCLYKPLEELDRQWLEHNRSANRGPSPPSAEEFHDALTWLLIQYQVECWLVEDDEDLWTTVLKMTRALCKQPYEQLTTELECITKVKTGVLPENPTDLDTAQNVWMKQVQQIHGVSENKARSLAEHYPTIQSLWQAYQDEDKTEDQKRELVAGMMTDKRYEPQTANRIYRLLTSTNPNEMI